MTQIIFFAFLLLSIILHEIAHGYTAYLFGDYTAKNSGRLTLNPIPHIDILGSLILPGILLFSGASFFIGWAKPVPIDSSNFKNPMRDMMWVALAGPLTNLSIAVLFSFAFKFFLVTSFLPSSIRLSFINLLISIVQMNLVLALFNLIPIPPLDGSRILIRFLSPEWQGKFYRFEPYGFGVIFALSYFGIIAKILEILILPFQYLLL